MPLANEDTLTTPEAIGTVTKDKSVMININQDLISHSYQCLDAGNNVLSSHSFEAAWSDLTGTEQSQIEAICKRLREIKEGRVYS